MTIDEFLRDLYPTEQAVIARRRINEHKARMMLMQEYPDLPQISNEYE